MTAENILFLGQRLTYMFTGYTETVTCVCSFVGCHFTELSSSTIASVLQSEHSALRELDLSDNELQDSGVEHLAAGLKSLNCKVHILR